MMRYLATLVTLALLPSSLAAQRPPLLPLPQEVRFGGRDVPIDTALRVTLDGHHDARLERAVGRALDRLARRAGVALPRAPGRGDDGAVVIRVARAGAEVPELGEDESYRLTVDGRVTLEAATTIGALRGLETLLQLAEGTPQGPVLRAAAIADRPRFPWRGLLVDAARHWQPPEVIRRTLDAMAAVKLNVLHWHLTEDQGFRIESRRYPRLHALGSDGQYYTQEEVRELVAYAADRGIRVVPEFDMPGHTTAWFVGHPELASAPGPYAIERRWGVHRPTMDPTRETTWDFLERFIAEMTRLFPDRHWHVGGDEVDPSHWNANPRIRAWMRERGLADAHALQTAFNARLFAILARRHRVPVGWDEILQPGLPSGAVIQSWRGLDGLRQATAQGRPAILSAPYYLDHLKTTAEMYLADPVPEGLAPAQAALVLGGEACMWAEYVTMETIDSRLWPRLAAVAERFWSPAAARDVADLHRRLPAASRHLAEAGARHAGHSERMLARMAPAEAVAPLAAFLRYARPRGFAGRGTTQRSPLNQLIDAAEPDPFTEAEMLALVEGLDAPGAREALDAHFRAMTRLPALLDGVRAVAPIAAEGDAVAAPLAEVGRMGSDLLALHARGARPDAAWREAADSLVARTEGKTFGLLRPVGVGAFGALVARLGRPQP